MISKTVLILSVVAVALSVEVPEWDEASCGCGEVVIPVCGNDGITYKGLCEMDCKHEYLVKNFPESDGVSLFRPGRCEAKDYEVPNVRVSIVDEELGEISA